MWGPCGGGTLLAGPKFIHINKKYKTSYKSEGAGNRSRIKKCLNLVIILARAILKGFQRFHTSKDVMSVTPFSFYGRYTTKKKTQWKISQPGEVFSKNQVKI